MITHKLFQPWTLFITALFAWMVAANGYFLYRAIESSNAPVSDSPYEDSLKYNDKYDALVKSAESGWKVELIDKSSALSFVIKNKKAEPLEGLKVAYKALFPADASLDQNGHFNWNNQKFAYTIDTPLSRDGLWILKIKAGKSELHYVWEQQILIGQK